VDSAGKAAPEDPAEVAAMRAKAALRVRAAAAAKAGSSKRMCEERVHDARAASLR
jgi:hypothetical protein